ncbi:ABC transporter ATP-binding protein [Nocardioides mangrovicus]|uniref:ABC transporter ATP-binding protein n=1 Tax=Nocardioides mangrovicus TaxID=2478913 RepID=UPI0018E0B68F|nr:ABC transporter ATP-binding protein [Nocardioides mangrovicus]
MSLRGLTVRYGGVLAVDDVRLDVAADSITGLIGPNGAGKTSLFNACAGLVRASSGSVELFGQDVTRTSVAKRARLGLGRTFQRVELFKTLSVHDNIAMGHESAYVWKHPYSLLQALPSERRETERVTEQVMELCRLTDIAGRTAGSLSTGQQRMVELARVLAGPSRLLLLDEPSSGLTGQERAVFAEIVEDAVRILGLGVFVVEHDMDLVARICAQVHVLNFGRLIFSGTTREAMASELVQRSYLGESAVPEASGGPRA